MTPVKVEVGQYREVNKGSLKGFFSLVIYPMGQKILDCRYFVQGDKRWFSFPQKEIKYTDGRQTEYIPYVSYLEKEYLEQLKIAVLQALKDVKPQESYGQTKSSAQTDEATRVQGKASSNGWEKPF